MTQTIAEILPAAARRFGSKTALLVEGRAFTFRELEELSNRAANGLVASGVRPGDRVTLYGPNCWEWLVAYYAVAKTGAVVTPINVMLTPEGCATWSRIPAHAPWSPRRTRVDGSST